MTLVEIRPGVSFNNEPAASFQRIEQEIGRQLDVNRSTVPYDEQEKLYKEWCAGMHPDIPVVLDPDDSIHVYREWDATSAHAVDSDDSQPLAKVFEDHGWIIVNKKELWHREYRKDRDKHYGEVVTPTSEDENMKKVLTQLDPKIDGRFVLIDYAAGTYWVVRNGLQLDIIKKDKEVNFMGGGGQPISVIDGLKEIK